MAAGGRLVADGVLDRRGLETVLLDERARSAASPFVWMIVCLELWYRSLRERCAVWPPVAAAA
jgi:hypothetical protein